MPCPPLTRRTPADLRAQLRRRPVVIAAIVILTSSLASTPAAAQWIGYPTAGGYMNMGFGPEDVVEAELGDASAFLDGAYRSMLIAYVPD